MIGSDTRVGQVYYDKSLDAQVTKLAKDYGVSKSVVIGALVALGITAFESGKALGGILGDKIAASRKED